MLLAEHPEFHVPDYLQNLLRPNSLHFISVKERHYFERTASGFTDRHAEEYRNWFPKPEGKKTGEFTPRYMYDYWVAEQLKRSAPNTKLIVMLRDPVERYWSGVHFSGMEPATFNEHFQRGLYAAQLARWYHQFPRESFLLVQYEKFNKSPLETYSEICRFIGIDDTVEPATEKVDTIINETKGKTKMPDDLRSTLTTAFSLDVDELLSAHPQIDRSLWKNFAN